MTQPTDPSSLGAARTELIASGRRSGGRISCRNPGCDWSTNAARGGWARFLVHARTHQKDGMVTILKIVREPSR